MPSLQSLFLSVLPLGMVLSAPLEERQTAEKMIVINWHHNKTTNGVSMHAFNADETMLLGQTPCIKFSNSAYTLDTGNFFNLPLTMNLDYNGFGNLTYAGKTYIVHSKKEISGGITCSRMFADDEAEAECIIPWAGQMPLESPLNFVVDCSASRFQKRYAEPPVAELSLPERNILELRQGAPSCTPILDTQRVGDGSPQNWWLKKQISETIECGDTKSCSTGFSNSESFTISADIGGPLNKWIDAGFSVQKTKETGNQYSCDGVPGDTVCIWYQMAHIQYTVKNVQKAADASCGKDTESAPFSITSPTKNNEGGKYSCMTGKKCKSKGSQYWEKR
ncbi:hypothetical protein B0J14DRAFT_253594 [Halenospora varia]|nr:hypothetical protein B0J14DRAFT_253594 [Halenospora varia]